MSATARVGLIGSRIKALRERRKLSQVDLASLFGLNDRQTVSAIETGVRRISAEELLCAVEKLEEPLEYFTDPFRLVGEGRFSWRHNGVGQDALEEYERQAGSWIATFRCLASQVGREPQLFRRSLRLTSHSNLEDAAEAGERVVKALRLGPRPAARLQRVMEEDLGILVPRGGSTDKQRNFGGSLPTARTGRRADLPKGGGRMSAFRPRTRTVSPPHLGCYATPVFRGSACHRSKERQTSGTASQQFRVSITHAEALPETAG